MEIILWLVVILGYSIAIYCVYRTFVFAFSLFQQVPYVPSDKLIAARSLEILDIKDGDNFVDIGSGDGRVVLNAYKRYSKKAKYTGIEWSKALVFQSNVKKIFNGNPKYITFVNDDVFKQDYTKYNKVYMYMTDNVTAKLMVKLKKEVPKNALVVSAVFKMGDMMKTDKVENEKVKIGKREYNIYIWRKK